MAAIEDIDYLWENSEKQSYLVYIDSSKRNRVAYPHPSQYVLEFEKPFRFVYGYDILDALIPTTMYNVESHNNNIVAGRILSSRTDWQSSTIPISSVLDEFAYVPHFAARLRSPDPGALAFIAKDNLTALSLDAAPTPTDISDTPAFVTVRYDAVTRPDPAHPVAVTLGGTTLFIADDDAMRGTYHATHDVLTSGNATTYAVRFACYRYFDTASYSTILSSTLYDILIQIHVFILPTQNYDNRQLQQALSLMMNAQGINVSHASAIPEQKNKYTYTCTDPFFFNIEATTCGSMLGFDELSVAGGMSESYVAFPHNFDTSRKLFLSYYDSTAMQQSITSPNMLDLGGPPYVVFRIPELEEHAFAGEGGNSNTVTGLGIFKLLAAGGGVQNLRFDFNNLVKKPFHPIGKLSRLSIRMELKSGDLYDFKGINHNILLVLKYLVPSVKGKLPRYNLRVLNSEYDPDAQKYLMARRRILNGNDEDIDADASDELRVMLNNNDETTQSTTLVPETVMERIRGLVTKYSS